MWYLLYTEPETHTQKWEEVEVESSDEIEAEINKLAKRVGVNSDDVMAFFEGDDFNA